MHSQDADKIAGARVARTVMITNRKGGSGKTSFTIEFASCLNRLGFRVLVVDLDSQPGNISKVLGADKTLCGTAELLGTRAYFEVEDLVQHLEFCDLVAADSVPDEWDPRLGGAPASQLSAVANEMASGFQMRRLARALERFKGFYDYILIDTAPVEGILVVNAYVAADDVIIPTDSDVMSGTGIPAILKEIDYYRSEFNPQLRLAGILHGDIEDTINDRAFRRAVASIGEAAHVFDHSIRHTTAVPSSHAAGRSVMDAQLRPTRKGGTTVRDDYMGVTEEFVALVGVGE